MTKAAAIHNFFKSFGIPAYKSDNVPEEAGFPHLTYDVVTSAFEEGQVGITVNLWYYGDEEKPANDKVNEISKRIANGGVMLSCDEGVIWVKRGSPWCQHIRDENDIKINRRYLNFIFEYLTFY